MEADIAQIKMLLWIILGLLVFFIASNILCRILNCGQPDDKLGDLWQKGKTQKVIEKARLRLQEHPHDISALYYGAKALATAGLHDSARIYLKRLMLIEPALHDECKVQLDAIDRMASDA